LWLRPRLAGVVVTTGRRVVGASSAHGRVKVGLDDGTSRSVDHVLLATGFRVDVHRQRFLARELLAGVRCVDGVPALDPFLESTAPGLHFVGAAAIASLGPVARFVSGTGLAGTALAEGIARGHRRTHASWVDPDTAPEAERRLAP
jgi:hypothetical protein